MALELALVLALEVVLALAMAMALEVGLERGEQAGWEVDPPSSHKCTHSFLKGSELQMPRRIFHSHGKSIGDTEGPQSTWRNKHRHQLRVYCCTHPCLHRLCLHRASCCILVLQDQPLSQ